MDISISSIKDKKTDEERLFLKVINDTNTKDYLVIDNTYDQDNEVSNIDRHIFSFPDQEVKKGEFVVLYTRSNAEGLKYYPLIKEGVKFHFFYWDMKKGHTVWNDDRDKVTLIKVSDFITKDV